MSRTLFKIFLLSLHAVRATYDPGRPFLPWLRAIARNRMAVGARCYVRRSANEVAVEHLPVTFAEDGANVPRDGATVILRLEEQTIDGSTRATRAIDAELRDVVAVEAAATTSVEASPAAQSRGSSRVKASKALVAGELSVQTSELIRHLATGAAPVHRLLPPSVRTAMWLGISLPYVCAVVVMKSAAIDFLGKIDARFALEQAAILATSVTAAIAAFASVIPATTEKSTCCHCSVAVWLGSLGQGCAHDWLRFGADGLQVRPDWECVPAVIFIGIIPAIAMVVMLRRGAPLAPRYSATLGALAVAALGNFGLRGFFTSAISASWCWSGILCSRPDLGASRSDWTSRFELAFRDSVRCTEGVVRTIKFIFVDAFQSPHQRLIHALKPQKLRAVEHVLVNSAV